MRCTFVPLLEGKCCFSSVVEHFLGKEEVPSSILGNSSKQTTMNDTLLGVVCYLSQLRWALAHIKELARITKQGVPRLRRGYLFRYP